MDTSKPGHAPDEAVVAEGLRIKGRAARGAGSRRRVAGWVAGLAIVLGGALIIGGVVMAEVSGADAFEMLLYYCAAAMGVPVLAGGFAVVVRRTLRLGPSVVEPKRREVGR